MQKVLIITYHWPPAGGPGVQRVLKFAKYLPDFGWEPLILTVAHGEYSALDDSLINEVSKEIIVFKTRSIEPFSLYKRFTGMGKEEKIPTAVLAENKISWKKKGANWIRLNLFIPDAKIGWLPFASQTGKHIVRQFKPDIIFSSSPPPTVHLIARKLKKWSGLKWVADFRDPWTDIHYYEGQTRMQKAKNLDTKLELSVLNSADSISCISQLDIDLDFGKKVSANKCINIPNGYDEADFPSVQPAPSSGNYFNLLHLGAIGPERIPHNLLKTIHLLHQKNLIEPGIFKVTLIGKVEPEVKDCVNQYKIEQYIEYVPYLPHIDAISQAQSADVLLLLITQSKLNRRILPGKIFEYMRLRKPVFALGPEDGEVSRILNETKIGEVIDYQNEKKIYQVLLNLIQAKKAGVLYSLSLDSGIEKFSRKNLTGRLVEVFNSLIN